MPVAVRCDGVCAMWGLLFFDSMIFASGKNAGMALEDSRRKNTVKGIVWRSLRSRWEKRKALVKSARKLKCFEKEEGWGDPMEIFFYRRLGGSRLSGYR